MEERLQKLISSCGLASRRTAVSTVAVRPSPRRSSATATHFTTSS